MTPDTVIFDKVNMCYGAGDLKGALQELEHLHREWHADPLRHVQIHGWQARIAWRSARYRRMVWELFALVIAAPTSLVQKYFGIARKNI